MNPMDPYEIVNKQNFHNPVILRIQGLGRGPKKLHI